MKNYTIKKRYLFLILIIVYIIASHIEEPEVKKPVRPKNTVVKSAEPERTTVKSTETKKTTEKPDIDPEVQKMYEKMAIDVIKEYNLVRDAAISKDGDIFNLVIIVDYSISKEYAKNLGDGFVRSLKTFFDDTPPGKEIGKGKYNYIIGVYYPNGKEVVMGAKASSSPRMSW